MCHDEVPMDVAKKFAARVFDVDLLATIGARVSRCGWRATRVSVESLGPHPSSRRLRRLSPVARFHCVRFTNRFARNGTSGFLPLGTRARLSKQALGRNKSGSTFTATLSLAITPGSRLFFAAPPAPRRAARPVPGKANRRRKSGRLPRKSRSRPDRRRVRRRFRA